MANSDLEVLCRIQPFIYLFTKPCHQFAVVEAEATETDDFGERYIAPYMRKFSQGGCPSPRLAAFAFDMAHHQFDSDHNKFEQSALNTVRRSKDRASYDKHQVAEIFRQAKICHVSFLHDHLPQCIPMIGALDETPDGDLFVYLHGYPRARFIQALLEEGTPMTVTATIFDGYVLALSLFNHSMNYRSAILHGVSLPLDDDDAHAKTRALKLIVDLTTPGRWENSRKPSDAELKGTGIIRMKVETGSAKIRTGGPKDDLKDLGDTELVSRTWTGVVPVSSLVGEPQPSKYAPALIPEHVKMLK